MIIHDSIMFLGHLEIMKRNRNELICICKRTIVKVMIRTAIRAELGIDKLSEKEAPEYRNHLRHVPRTVKVLICAAYSRNINSYPRHMLLFSYHHMLQKTIVNHIILGCVAKDLQAVKVSYPYRWLENPNSEETNVTCIIIPIAAQEVVSV